MRHFSCLRAVNRELSTNTAQIVKGFMRDPIPDGLYEGIEIDEDFAWFCSFTWRNIAALLEDIHHAGGP